MATQTDKEDVLWDSKYLKVFDNDVTNKKIWLPWWKKIYVGTMADFEVIYYKKN